VTICKLKQQEIHSKLQTYATLNDMNRKTGSGRFYTIQLGNGSGLFYSCWGPHRVTNKALLCYKKRLDDHMRNIILEANH